jgi:uncharacterized FlaG/YvyC family protein
MSSSKSITGVSESASKEREHLDALRPGGIAGRMVNRRTESSDVLPAIAVTELQGAADSMGRKVDVQYDPDSGLVVFSIYDEEGGELVRRIPPEEAIRMAQRIKDQRSANLSDVL